MKRILITIMAALLLASCGDKQPKGSTDPNEKPKKTVVVPSFNADSAYQFVAKQTSFGPRVPATQAHADCAEWLTTKLSEYADTVIVQEFRTKLFNGAGIDGKNIVAVFHPEAKKRIVLCAHWDSRPFADHDSDEANTHKPIDGANDGASGVGVLLEMARQLSMKRPDIGVDIVLFDVEDYGSDGQSDSWGLGSQYWSRNPHREGYHAAYGILLDMVGATGARFRYEQFSATYARGVLTHVWNIADRLGYGGTFVAESSHPITDDHYYVNTIAGIPMIDIIHQDDYTGTGFPSTWHTMEDNINHIDKNTLAIVGKTLLCVIYNEK